MHDSFELSKSEKVGAVFGFHFLYPLPGFFPFSQSAFHVIAGNASFFKISIIFLRTLQAFGFRFQSMEKKALPVFLSVNNPDDRSIPADQRYSTLEPALCGIPCFGLRTGFEGYPKPNWNANSFLSFRGSPAMNSVLASIDKDLH